jgi:hypothetical protein
LALSRGKLIAYFAPCPVMAMMNDDVRRAFAESRTQVTSDLTVVKTSVHAREWQPVPARGWRNSSPWLASVTAWPRVAQPERGARGDSFRSIPEERKAAGSRSTANGRARRTVASPAGGSSPFFVADAPETNP